MCINGAWDLAEAQRFHSASACQSRDTVHSKSKELLFERSKNAAYAGILRVNGRLAYHLHDIAICVVAQLLGPK